MRISDWSSDVCSSDLEAMGRILAGGVRDMADWVNKLYGQAFAAVYVQPGARVAVHLEQPLDIDYAAKESGRASCRVRVCQDVWNTVVAVPLKKNHNTKKHRCNKVNEE